jgi:hypothetical protein
MRENSLYNQLLDAEVVSSLANKYSFKVIFTPSIKITVPSVVQISWLTCQSVFLIAIRW